MSTTIHVGNLSFNLGEKDLLDYFSKYGKVTDSYIVRRGGRPRGYGFVEFSSTKEADNALAANGDEVNGRVINIELAKGKIVKSNFQNTGPRNNYNNNNGGYGNNNYNNNNGGYRNNNNYNNNNYDGPRYNNRPPRNYDNFDQDGDGRPPRIFNRGGRNFYTLRPSGYNNGPRRYNNGGYNNGGYNNGPRRYNNGGYNNGGYNNNGPRRNYRKSETEKEKSLSTIYVSNLPFSYDEKELANLFNEFKVKTAHVVQTRNGRSRGFGFVEFETEEDQLNAVKAKDQTTVKGSDGADRTISVKVSLVEKPSESTSTTTTTTTTPTTSTTTN